MDHQVAFWAGLFAFFSSLLAIGIFDLLEKNHWLDYIGALIVAFITGASIYTKQRLHEAKKKDRMKEQKNE